MTAWRDLLAAAENTLRSGPLPIAENEAERCWIEEVRAGLPYGSLIAKHFGPSPLRGSRRHLLTLHLPVDGQPLTYAQHLRSALNRALREADLGWADSSGSTIQPGKGLTEVRFEVAIVDDLGSGLALVKDILRQNNAEPGAELRGPAGDSR